MLQTTSGNNIHTWKPIKNIGFTIYAKPGDNIYLEGKKTSSIIGFNIYATTITI